MCPKVESGRLNVERRSRHEDFAVLDRGAPVIAAGQQAVARGRADGARSVGVGETSALARKAIKVRRVQALGAVGRGGTPAEVIGEDDDDVGLEGIRGAEGHATQRDEASDQRKKFHGG